MDFDATPFFCHNIFAILSVPYPPQPDNEADSRLLIWYVEQDVLLGYDFSAGQTIQPFSDSGSDFDYEDLITGNFTKNKGVDVQRATEDSVTMRFPREVLWDPMDPRLLVVQAAPVPGGDQPQKPQSTPASAGLLMGGKGRDQTGGSGGSEVDKVVSLFATNDNGVLLHDSFPMEPAYNKLLGVSVPSFYFVYKTRSPGLKEMVSPVTMRNFVGLENANAEVRKAMLDFAYHLTIGNLDEAFKAIKLIKSETVWENMAKMCVKTRRLDVAALCLGHMGHARGANALRDSAHEPELNARVAMLALQLGMLVSCR
eukprot:sb/3467026/